MDDGSSTQRESLRFSDSVGSAFAFVRHYGFEEVEAAPTIVRFLSPDVTLTVYHGRSSYEIGVEIGSREPSGSTYSLSEVIRLSDEAEAARYRNPAFATREGVQAGVESAAALLRKYGDALLRNTGGCFLRLAEQRKRWSQTYALDVLASQLRPRADEAFHNGQYAEAAELYERIKPLLTPAEAGKLQLAKRKAKQD